MRPEDVVVLVLEAQLSLTSAGHRAIGVAAGRL
ncbi:hypothetical protein JOD27_003834 [Lentzea nigeriaca]|nr:hypothetical protein [Lentzea nigeriaca]